MPDSPAAPSATTRPPTPAGASAYPHWLRGWHTETTDVAARLRRLLQPDNGPSYAHDLAARILDQLETLDAALRPTAADRYRANLDYADDAEALAHALHDTDRATEAWRSRVGSDPIHGLFPQPAEEPGELEAA